MTDLEITRLCAEAMGYQILREWGKYVNISETIESQDGPTSAFDPLHEDAQAMALVKKFHLDIEPCFANDEGDWMVSVWKDDATGRQYNYYNADLNRAICECVAKMQAAK